MVHAQVFEYWQPEAGIQESTVHGSKSLQVTAEPLQVPPEQVSLVVQALPSFQATVLLV